MPFIKLTEEEKERANTSSIVDYLTAHGESVKRTGREYVWEAPSGKVSVHGCEWYSQYELVGGGAIGFVQKFFGLSYPDAVRSLLGNNIDAKAIGEKKPSKTEEKKPFELPEKHTDMRRVYGYLIHERLIDRQVIGILQAGRTSYCFGVQDHTGAACPKQQQTTQSVPIPDEPPPFRPQSQVVRRRGSEHIGTIHGVRHVDGALPAQRFSRFRA